MSKVTSILTDADLNGYVDGQIEPHRAAQIAAALDADPKARARVEAWKKQNEALRTMFASIVFEPVPLRLTPTTLAKGQVVPERAAAATRESADEDALAGRADAVRSGVHPVISPGAGLGSIVAIGAAFLLGIALSLGLTGLDLGQRFLAGWHWTQVTPISPGREVAKRAVEAHLTFATDLNRPVEIPASDEVHLVKWIQHRLTMPIRIPDLRPQGWNLIGGRVVPGELGPAAFLIYGNGIERLGLYIARTNASQADDFAIPGGNGAAASVGYWIDEPFGYAITTSRSANWLERNGPALYESVKAQARDNASAF